MFFNPKLQYAVGFVTFAIIFLGLNFLYRNDSGFNEGVRAVLPVWKDWKVKLGILHNVSIDNAREVLCVEGRRENNSLIIFGFTDNKTNVSIHDTKCPNKRRRVCIFTNDAKLYNESQAVVFPDGVRLDSFPTYRPSTQKWVLRTMETPVNTVLSVVKRLRLKQQRFLFNLTSTYSRSSTVPTPYFDAVCRLADNSSADNETSSLMLSYASRKDRAVAWFVTHCWTSSRRERYVQELQRHIAVDVYGLCGKLRCPLTYSGQCLDLLERRYFFYLSFENSLCIDYITEKFWQILRRRVVAVALGAANYTDFVPASTHLDVRDFRSPRQLAERMRWLMGAGRWKYAQMLADKSRLECTIGSRKNFVERLCEHLDKLEGVEETVDLNESWNARSMCVESEKFYRGVADMVANRYNETG